MPAPAGASERGRVVLVLSGGGARGAAHVGVLRWLERERIPIDSIVGTSMGSIIGGLYASGLTADELGQVIRGIDWVDAFDDEPARKHLTYRRKRDDDDFLVDIGLGFRDGEARMPRGIIQAQKLNLYLRELALPVATARNFDALPTPFRAVAADLGSGDTVILQRGDLASAMRASMSAPGVFAPAEIDGRILVDGGVAMNLPIEVARNWGADVIIAVDVGSGPVPVEDLDSALAVTNQMLDILIERETREQRALLTPRDVLVRPQLGDIGSTDFLLAEPAMEAGLVAAEAARAALKQYAVSEAEYDAFVRRRLAERAVLAGGPVDAPPQRVPAFVVLETDADVDPDLITAQMATAPGAPLSIAKLREDLARIYGLGLFEQVDYRWTESDEGEGIVVDARARSWGPGYLAFGLAYEEGFEGSSNFSVSARALRTALNRLGGEWRTNVTLGTDLRLQSEFYQPLSVARRWFIAPQIDAFQRNIRAFENEEAVARYRLTTSEASVAVGREISNVAELRFGVFRGDGDARVKVG
ncbi:MAG: patatin-like phospholipase family protein, partial [Pseudomonadota bacterium]